MKKALEAWLHRTALLRTCKEMGAMRRRHAAQEQAALSFALWCMGTAQQRLAASQVGWNYTNLDLHIACEKL